MSALRGGSVLICGKTAGFTLRFLRNVLVARLISVEDFGIAGTLMIAMTFIGMAANLNLDKMVIQDRSGGDAHFVASVKSLNMLRGLLVAVVLYFSAEPVAWLLHQSEYVWAYQTIALIPLINCLTHPDLQRMQRQMRFAPAVVSDIGSLSLTLLALWPVALIYGDFRLMLVLYLIEAAGRTGITHIMAERPFRLAWNLDIARRGLRFGWPLLLAGILGFMVMQGDRIIVANQYGARALGYFSAAMNLTMTPMLQAADLVRTFFLPVISRVQDDARAYDESTIFTLQLTLCAAAATALAFALFGPVLLIALFGEKYREGAPLVGLLGMVWSLQLLRSGTTTAAIARGQTKNQLIGNVVQALALPFAVGVALTGGSLILVLTIGVGGKLAGFVASLMLLKSRARFGGMAAMTLPFALGGSFLAVLLFQSLTAPGHVIDRPGPAILPTLLLFATIASCRLMHVRLWQLFGRIRALRSG